MKVQIDIVNTSSHPLPEYATVGSAGIDLRANLNDTIVLHPGARILVPTGIRIALPMGYEAQIRPRSGLALNYGITVLNAPGTIDADYRGELKVLLIHLGTEAFEIKNGERIAQMVIAPYIQAQWHLKTELDSTLRAAGGYGSTGNN